MPILRVQDSEGNWIEIPAIVGPKGDPGEKGEPGSFATLTEEEKLLLKGADGKDGKDGADGKDGEDGTDGTPCTHRWSGTTLYVTSASGTSSANLKGEQGDKGEQGEKGDKGDKGDTGDNGEAGYTPLRGTDYWTDADKAEIKAYVDEAILGGAW